MRHSSPNEAWAAPGSRARPAPSPACIQLADDDQQIEAHAGRSGRSAGGTGFTREIRADGGRHGREWSSGVRSKTTCGPQRRRAQAPHRTRQQGPVILGRWRNTELITLRLQAGSTARSAATWPGTRAHNACASVVFPVPCVPEIPTSSDRVPAPAVHWSVTPAGTAGSRSVPMPGRGGARPRPGAPACKSAHLDDVAS